MKSFSYRPAIPPSAVPLRPKVALLTSWLLVLAAGFLSTPASAALTRNLQVVGTATGDGVCSITIESFGFDPDEVRRGTAVEAPYIIDVTIPEGSSPVSSANRIRSDVDLVLPADYVVTIDPVLPSTVKIARTGPGTFSMSVTDNVPGQRYDEVRTPPYVPIATPIVLLLMAAVLVVGSAWILTRRRSPISPA